MEGYEFSSLKGVKRVLIVCSTWGDGEMPDNAQELWEQAEEAEEGLLKGVNFAILGLGDENYDQYC